MYPIFAMATLRELRTLANLTQKELADKVGVSKQHVSSWERGQYTPSPSSFRKICRALKCKRADLEISAPDPKPSSFLTCENDMPLEVVVSTQQKRIIELQQMLDIPFEPFEVIATQQARIDELEQQVETGSSLLTNMVTMMQESEERIDSQQARIHALETILKQNGLGDFIP